MAKVAPCFSGALYLKRPSFPVSPEFHRSFEFRNLFSRHIIISLPFFLPSFAPSSFRVPYLVSITLTFFDPLALIHPSLGAHFAISALFIPSSFGPSLFLSLPLFYTPPPLNVMLLIFTFSPPFSRTLFFSRPLHSGVRRSDNGEFNLHPKTDRAKNSLTLRDVPFRTGSLHVLTSAVSLRRGRGALSDCEVIR